MTLDLFSTNFDFAAAEMPVWCKVDELAHLPYNVQQNVAIPKEDGEYVSCNYYYFNYTQFSDNDFVYNWNRYVCQFLSLLSYEYVSTAVDESNVKSI